VIDRLLGTMTQGNLGRFGTPVVTLDTRSGFAEFCDKIAIEDETNAAGLISSLIPLGDARFDFEAHEPWLKRWNEKDDAIAPLIGVAYSAEQLAAFCRTRPKFSHLVIANGAGNLRNTQFYYDIAESQRLLVFANHDETEALEWLAQTGCAFWRIGEAELAHGVNGPLFGPLARWAENYELLDSVELVECSDDALEGAATDILSAERNGRPEEETPLAQVLGRGWQLLNEAASWVAQPPRKISEGFTQRLAELRASIRRNFAVIPPETRQMLAAFAEKMESFLQEEANIGIRKGDILIRCVGEEKRRGNKIAVLVRNEAAFTGVSEFLGRFSETRSVPVISVRALSADLAFDVLLVASWPGGEQLRRAVSKLVAPRIRLIGYAFERSWAKHAQSRLLSCSALPELPAAQKGVLAFGDKGGCEWPKSESVREKAPAIAALEDFDVWRWEATLRRTRPAGAARGVAGPDTVPATFVRFNCDCFAFLTPGHALPVATSILSVQTGKTRLPERTVAEWHKGDFIVFAESGARELVREIADRLLGDDADRLRSLARIWQDALRRSRFSATEFYSRAQRLGWKRCLATARGYVMDEQKIGPESRADLEMIAKVTNDASLLSVLDRVWDSIQQIWGAHQSAGSRIADELRQQLPGKLQELRETATRLEMGDLGVAWIVMVEDISGEQEPRIRNEVDRLRWPDGCEPQRTV
jgi:hypothetical protein